VSNPAMSGPAMSGPAVIRWGFIGAGWIATTALAPAVHAADGAVLQAVASRDEHRSRALHPERVHDRYEDLLEDESVDAVYVNLANDQHEPWTLRALAAGKHVLCEKPLGLTAPQVRSMADAAAAADRLLVEAAWSAWHPRSRRLKALAADGSLGDILAIDSAFTFPGSLDGNYRLDPAMGGGALLDVGCYQVHCWVSLTQGAHHLQVEHCERTLSTTGVDLTTRAAGTIDGSTRVAALASFAHPEQQALSVTGSVTTAATREGAAFTCWRQPASLAIGETIEQFEPVDAYRLMIESVSRRISGDVDEHTAWVLPLENSIRVAEILDALAGPTPASSPTPPE
jgi:predicted dehydrogenase